MATQTMNKKLYWFVGIALLAFIIFGGLYSFGYRFQGGKITSPGTVIVKMPLSGTVVYVDGSEKVSSSKDNETLSFSLPAGAHTILLGKMGYWPWKKELVVSSHATIHLAPFMLNQTVNGTVITGADPEYGKILAMVKNNTLPGENNKKLSPDGSTAVWYKDGTLYAEWVATSTQPEIFCSANGLGNCDKSLKVMTLTVAPTSIDFYKDRSDVVLLGIGDSLSAVELDTRGTQNFEPLYKGGTPSFVRSPKGTSLFVFDGKSLMEIAE